LIWSAEELLFLTENYPHKGLRFCCDNMNRSRDSIKQKAKQLKIQVISVKYNRMSEEEYDNKLLELGVSAYRIGPYINNRTPTKHGCTICNTIWKPHPSNISRLISGCPGCAKYGPNLNLPHILYLVSFLSNDIEYYKLGITKNKEPKSRYISDWNKLNMKVLWTKQFNLGFEAKIVEQRLKTENSIFLINTEALNTGNTETFTTIIKEPII
jgi:hypothetical protein